MQKNSTITILIGLMGVFCISVTGFSIGKTEDLQQDGKKSLVQPSDATTSNTGIKTYNICDYGAIGDGTTLNTNAFQAAINACTKDSGGIVMVPGGDYLTGTIELKSNVTLYLSTNARILGSKKQGDYIRGNGVPSGNGNMVMIYAVNARNLTIEGRGTIDGQGAAFYTGTGDATSPIKNKNPDPNAPPPNRDRPHLMIFYHCDNLKIRDIFLTASAYHCMRILQSTHINFDGIRIYNRVNKNNDGFHFNNCEYIKISNCEVICQDDACALFGSNKFVTVTNCTFSTRWAIFRFGSGESQNISVSNCLIYDTYGCVIKISAGRSRIENLSFSNIIMRNVTGPIGIGFSGGSDRPRGNDTTSINEVSYVRNIAFNGIRASVVPQPINHPDIPFNVSVNNGEQNSCITLNGLGKNYIENVSFTDVQIVYAGGGTSELAAKRDIQQLSAEYFGVWNQAPFGPPAFGMYARNVKGLTLDNVRFEVKNPDFRPAVIFDHVIDAAVNNLSVQGNQQAESTFRFIDTQDVLLTATRILTPAAVFLQVEGTENNNIKIDGGDLTKAATLLTFSRGATNKVVKIRE